MMRRLGYWGARLNEEFEFKTSGQIQTEAYEDMLGNWTGPGGVLTNLDGSPIQPGQSWTEAEAYALYGQKLQKFCNAVDGALRVEVSQNQFDALVLMCWNIGIAAFCDEENNSVLRNLNLGRFEDASASFLKWKRGTLKGGELGWDGKPVRDPDGNIMPKGKRWFKLVRGIFRRHCCEALLFNDLDWKCTYDKSLIRLGKETHPVHYGWKDEETDATDWRELFDVARLTTLPEAPSSPAPATQPADVGVEAGPAAPSVAVSVPDPLEPTEIPVEAPEITEPKKKPVGTKDVVLVETDHEFDGSVPAKPMEMSDTFKGAVAEVIGGFIKRASKGGVIATGPFGLIAAAFADAFEHPVLGVILVAGLVASVLSIIAGFGKMIEVAGFQKKEQGRADGVQLKY